MVKRSDVTLSIYEKAMPDSLSWSDRLNCTRACGYDLLEISIDESDYRLSRLDDADMQRKIKEAITKTGVPIHSLCLSAHRKYPLGAREQKVQEKAVLILEKALAFAQYLGIQRIQLAGYDVYYEESGLDTRENFIHNLRTCVNLAAKAGVVLGFETMELPFMCTISKALAYVKMINSPYLQIYPDLGNITNGNKNHEMLLQDMDHGKGHIIAVHLKETREGVYRNLQFGEGRVNFKEALQVFYDQGVRIFGCEIWDDGSGKYQENMRRTVEAIF
ncbi:MAG: L-ribulose-5-phosphate 3-epimerase [Erysipelotrichaceae bacterium]|jgi:L-ribulose-5-phosphate 3-epimerase|nr:L-ribulose-5-phosphate 3-epimerase [Erysipelotrichaceae bacterium]